DRASVALDGGAVLPLPTGMPTAAGASITVGIRPEHIDVGSDGPLAVSVEQAEVLGAETILHTRLATGAPITVSVRGISPATPGPPLRLTPELPNTHVFDDKGLALRAAS